MVLDGWRELFHFGSHILVNTGSQRKLRKNGFFKPLKCSLSGQIHNPTSWIRIPSCLKAADLIHGKDLFGVASDFYYFQDLETIPRIYQSCKSPHSVKIQSGAHTGGVISALRELHVFYSAPPSSHKSHAHICIYALGQV